MRIWRIILNRKTVACCLSTLHLGVACLVLVLTGLTVFSVLAKAADEPAEITSIKGTCTFGGRKGTWSAELRWRGDDTYDADYASDFGGKILKYVGTIKTDLRTEISGIGKASGGGANGIFEFSGMYGDNGMAKCSYWEVGRPGRRGRSGTLTVEKPK